MNFNNKCFNFPELCPNLYFNHLINNRNPNEEIEWTEIAASTTYLREHQAGLKYVTTDETITKRKLALIHCFDIEKFEFIYLKYISLLSENQFLIMVSFHRGNINKFNTQKKFRDITFIRVKNRGHDIGAKFSLLDYVYRKGITFDLLLYLHSKSNSETRKLYFDSLLGNEEILKDNMDFILKEGNDIILNCMEYKDLDEKYESNKTYHREILNLYKFLNASSFNSLKLSDDKHMEFLPFSQGNCNMMSKNFVDKVYRPHYRMLYSLLNDTESVDINWLKIRLDKRNDSNTEVYNQFKQLKKAQKNESKMTEYVAADKAEEIHGNDFVSAKRHLPDGMIEHVFERIYINLCLLFDLKFKLI